MRLTLVILSLCLAATNGSPRKSSYNTKKQAVSQDASLGMFDGTSTTIEKHPYLVRVYGEGYFWCAGTIVSSSWIVTSAMCTTLEDNEPADLVIVAGSNGTEGEGTSYAVKQIVRHPKFNEDTYDYSYSCVQVDGSFTWGSTMQPLYLPAADVKSYTSLTVAGWGLASYDSDDDTYETLMEGTMKWMPKLYCEILYDMAGWFMTNRLGCAFNKRKTTLCTGDIGDPFTIDSVYYGHFVYPYPAGDVCSSSSKPVLVAKIYPVVDWIKNITGATSL